jgi:hypothetical protein
MTRIAPSSGLRISFLWMGEEETVALALRKGILYRAALLVASDNLGSLTISPHIWVRKTSTPP